MSTTQSCVIVVPIAQKEIANRLWCAQGLDDAPLPGNSFTIELGESEEGVATHVALHMWADMDLATAWLAMPLNGGTIPPLEIDLAEVGLTEQQAIDLCAAVDPWCRTGGDPGENFAAMTQARALFRVSF